MSSVRPPVKKFDKILLASKLKAYQEGPEIPNTSNSWCYGLKVQGNNQQMPIIAFKGVGEITVPVSNKVIHSELFFKVLKISLTSLSFYRI